MRRRAARRSTAAPASACSRWRWSSRPWPRAAAARRVGPALHDQPDLRRRVDVALRHAGDEGASCCRRSISGEINCCMALTEPDAGTNTLEMRSLRRRRRQRLAPERPQDLDHRRARARPRCWWSRAPRSSTTASRAADGLSMFMIDVEREGLTHTPIEKLGTNTLASSNVFFDDVRIEPRASSSARSHGGWHELLDVLNTERIVTTAGAGRRRRARDPARRSTTPSERKVFGGKPIGALPGRCSSRSRRPRRARVRAADELQGGDELRPGPALRQRGQRRQAARRAGGVGRPSSTRCRRMGGMGYAKEFHVERLWRDARLFRFAPVSEEMVLNFIAQPRPGHAALLLSARERDGQPECRRPLPRACARPQRPAMLYGDQRIGYARPRRPHPRDGRLPAPRAASARATSSRC